MDLESKESEDIAQKHRKEKKELQAKIQALKKTATKGDKKKKKEVSEEISRLETDLERRQAEELSKFIVAKSDDVPEISDQLNSLDVNGEEATNEHDHHQQQQQQGAKLSKAQRRREKKANEIKERELRISEQEADNIHGARHVETENIKGVLKDRNLMISEIPSDGNCLYCAIDDQLKQRNGEGMGVEQLRAKASDWLLENRREFLPFLSHPDTGEMLTDDQYDDYCRQVATTNAWGGQVELKALSKALNCRIEVLQYGSPTITLGDSGPLLTVTYHKHMYSLGAHYNSVKPYTEEEEEKVA